MPPNYYKEIFDQWLLLGDIERLKVDRSALFMLETLYRKINRRDLVPKIYEKFFKKIAQAQAQDQTRARYEGYYIVEGDGVIVSNDIEKNIAKREYKLYIELASFYIVNNCIDDAINIINKAQLIDIYDKCDGIELLIDIYRIKNQQRECIKYARLLDSLIIEKSKYIMRLYEISKNMPSGDRQQIEDYIRQEQRCIDRATSKIHQTILLLSKDIAEEQRGGLALCDSIILSDRADISTFSFASSQLPNYIECIADGDARITQNDAAVRVIELNTIVPNTIENDIYRLSNACLYKTKDNRMIIIARYVSYYLTDDNVYQHDMRLAYLGSKNYIGEYDATSCTVGGFRELKTTDPPIRTYHIKGLEDCRMIEYNNELYVSATTFDYNKSAHPQIVVSRMMRTRSDNPTGDIATLDTLINTTLQRCSAEEIPQKNWTPFVYRGRLYYIYSLDPLIMFEYDAINMQIMHPPIIRKKVINSRYVFLRGSTPLIPWRRETISDGSVKNNDGTDNYLCIAHEAYDVDGSRLYVHRFVLFDNDLNITNYSLPFAFIKKDVEFTLGMCYDNASDSLIVPVSVRDRDTKLVYIPRSKVNNMLYNK